MMNNKQKNNLILSMWCFNKILNVFTILLILSIIIINVKSEPLPGKILSTKNLSRLLDSQKLIKMLLRQYPHVTKRSEQNDSNAKQQLQQEQHKQDDNSNNIFTSLNAFIQSRQRNASDITSDIFFKYYDSNGDLVYQSNLEDPRKFDATKCNVNERFAILLHGWRESCNVTWMKQLINKLKTNRGGCIICMDYSKYAAESYVRLVRLYEPIVQILTLELLLLDYVGFDMNKGYMFGFSYGGQLATEAGRRIGRQRIKEIDTCDMAGPGFDQRQDQPNHRDAAQNVQCIHTSRDKGTRFYNCHQDWRLGNCGLEQIASNRPPLGSHGLCPYMYVNSFDHDFVAVEKPLDCISTRMASYWPNKFKMGYMESRKRQVTGELFAYTGKSYPFNIVPNGTENVIARASAREARDSTDYKQSNNNNNNDTVLQRLRQKILKYVFYNMRFF